MYYTDRSDSIQLFSLVTILFVLLFIFWKRAEIGSSEKNNLRLFQWSGLFFRIILIFGIPNLSDDYFRFLWDGLLTAGNVSPYAFLPSEMAEFQSLTAIQQELFNGMNSKNYFSVYPPIDQFIFALSVTLFPDGILAPVVFIKCLMVLSESVVIFCLPLLLKLAGGNPFNSILYILNPLVIIEISGNLHFETFTICFLTLTFFFLFKSRYLFSAVFFFLAAGIKLIPFILMPALFRYLKRRQAVLFTGVVFSLMLLSFLPFAGIEVFRHMNSGVGLYFHTFEFNAPVYYLFREIGFHFKGYNMIREIGTTFGVMTLLLTLFLAVGVKSGDNGQLIKTSFYALLIFYCLSTTVHPWYIINVLFFGILAGFPLTVLVWTFTVFWSYAAYGSVPFRENIFLISLEYLLFFATFYAELRKRKSEVVIPHKI